MTDQSFQQLLQQVPEDRHDAMNTLRKLFSTQLPKGFEELIKATSLDFVVPHSLYPNGYHCNPKQPLPFISIVSQKNVLTIHHLGFYASPELTEWFVTEYSKKYTPKLDMGKGCLKFKKMEEIPYDLLKSLCKKLTVKEWVDLYEKAFRK